MHPHAALAEVFLDAVPTELLGTSKKMFDAFPPSRRDVWHSLRAVATMSQVLSQTHHIPCRDKFWRRPWQRWA